MLSPAKYVLAGKSHSMTQQLVFQSTLEYLVLSEVVDVVQRLQISRLS